MTKNELLSLNVYEKEPVGVIIKTNTGGHYALEAHVSSDGDIDFTYSDLNTLLDGLKTDGGRVESEAGNYMTLESVIRQTCILPDSITTISEMEVGY